MPLVRTPEEWDADGKQCFEAALRDVALGWAVIPLCPPDHIGVGKEHQRDCASPGKAPLVAGWTNFEKPPSEADVRLWWRQWPNANVGVVMGKVSGLVGIDIDGAAGERLLLEASRGHLPGSWQFQTPGGGRRLLYVTPNGKVLRIARRKDGKKQELRVLGEGSQTVVPPSRHAAGGYYEWVDGYAL